MGLIHPVHGSFSFVVLNRPLLAVKDPRNASQPVLGRACRCYRVASLLLSPKKQVYNFYDIPTHGKQTAESIQNKN
jgi:hypothetical protein